MPSWETIGVIVGIVAAALVGLTLFSLFLSWLLTELIREFRETWEKADPRRKAKED